MQPNVVENVVEKEMEIIAHLQKNKKLTADEISKMLMVSERTIQRYINSLQRKGLIKRIGPARGGYWEVIVR